MFTEIFAYIAFGLFITFILFWFVCGLIVICHNETLEFDEDWRGRR